MSADGVDFLLFILGGILIFFSLPKIGALLDAITSRIKYGRLTEGRQMTLSDVVERVKKELEQ